MEFSCLLPGRLQPEWNIAESGKCIKGDALAWPEQKRIELCKGKTAGYTNAYAYVMVRCTGVMLNKRGEPMKNEIGVLAGLGSEGYSPEYVAGFGLKVCQLLCWEQELFVDELGERVKKQSEDAGVTITSLWAGWPGPAVRDFVEGPVTLGLVP